MLLCHIWLRPFSSIEGGMAGKPSLVFGVNMIWTLSTLCCQGRNTRSNPFISRVFGAQEVTSSIRAKVDLQVPCDICHPSITCCGDQRVHFLNHPRIDEISKGRWTALITSHKFNAFQLQQNVSMFYII